MRQRIDISLHEDSGFGKLNGTILLVRVEVGEHLWEYDDDGGRNRCAVDRSARAAGGVRPGGEPDRRGDAARDDPPGGPLAPGVLLLDRAAGRTGRGDPA